MMTGTGRTGIATLAIVLLSLRESYGRVVPAQQEEACRVLVNGGFGEPQPLVLSVGQGDRGDFVYPEYPGSNYLVAQPGESWRIACPGNKLHLNTIDSSNETLITCAGDTKFILQGEKLPESVEKISCEQFPDSDAVRTGKPCNGGTMVEIGFTLYRDPTGKKEDEFHPVMELCHNDTLGHTIYAHTKIVAHITSAQKGIPRPIFRKGNFFHGIPVSKIYSRNAQRDVLTRILKSAKLAAQYIKKTGPSFFSRGHLNAKGDYLYGSHQRATFYYVNVVPMWQNINGGNWESMESSVRAFAGKSKMDLDIWVGGLGTLTLKDEGGEEHEIFLHMEENGRAVPVPKVLFKVVYHYPSQSGIVFLSANNPFLKNLTAEYRLCNDVCDRIDYITWNNAKPDRGLSYCCEVDDFRNIFPGLPRFETKYLLT